MVVPNRCGPRKRQHSQVKPRLSRQLRQPIELSSHRLWRRDPPTQPGLTDDPSQHLALVVKHGLSLHPCGHRRGDIVPVREIAADQMVRVARGLKQPRYQHGYPPADRVRRRLSDRRVTLRGDEAPPCGRAPRCNLYRDGFDQLANRGMLGGSRTARGQPRQA
jgi:hypothetical protein